MTKMELRFVAQFLEELNDRFSNDGCSDFEIPNTPENVELLIGAVKYGCGSDAEEIIKEIKEETREKLYTNNSILCGYLAKIAKEQSE